MATNGFDILFVDTSALRRVGFSNPDFHKLLVRSRDQSLRIAVAEIAWEEWRTQMRDKECQKVRSIKAKFEEMKASAPGHRILGRLPPPALAMWDENEIDAASKAALADYAAEHRIEIIPIGADHGERSWRRYFHVKVEPPLNPANERENRRKDIPDSWIFEAAVDLAANNHHVAALCNDDNLATALEGIGLQVFRSPGQVIEELERAETSSAEVPPSQQAIAPATDALTTTLSAALDGYRNHERKVLSFVAYFGTPGKGQLADLLSRSGLAPEIIRNATERLVMSGLIRDTGHHYILSDKRLVQLAVADVEDEIIKLLEEGPSNGL